MSRPVGAIKGGFQDISQVLYEVTLVITVCNHSPSRGMFQEIQDGAGDAHTFTPSMTFLSPPQTYVFI